MESDLISVLRRFVQEGAFGSVELLSVEPDPQSGVGLQFASTLTFVLLKLNGVGGEKALPLVIKRGAENIRTDLQFNKFHNEFFMYKEIIPALGFDEKSTPKMYCGKITEDDLAQNILVFENLKYHNYRNSKESPFLDFGHISIALKKIAKFHSMSYVLKYGNCVKFHELAGKLKIKESVNDKDLEFDKMNYATVERGVRAFQKRNTGDEGVLEEFLKSMKFPLLVWRVLGTPEEPFGVLCHGDFCNNNVMYKYDEKGSPVDCALLDFQTSLYGSPAVDLAFYLYMHTTAELRERHWLELLDLYWQELRSNVPTRIQLPSLAEFLEHFASRAVYGYLISSFFLPVMLDPNFKFPFDAPLEKRIELFGNIGGEEAEEKIVDIVSHMYEHKYIHAFLDFGRTQILAR